MADSGTANLLYLQVLVEVSRDSFLCDLLWSLLRWLCLIDDNLVRGVGLGETFEYIIERNSIEVQSIFPLASALASAPIPEFNALFFA